MNHKHRNAINLTPLATAMAVALGSAVLPSNSPADDIIMNWSGVFTMLQPDGVALVNGDGPSTAPWYQRRTAVSGTLSYDTAAGSATATIAPFSFFGSGLAIATTVTMQSIGDGSGGPGTLVLSNMGFNWNSNNGIPVSLVLDGNGLFSAFGTGVTTGSNVSGAGSLPASDNTLFNFGKTSYTLPIGPAPLVSTTWNTTDIGTVNLGTNPSGTLPLITDSVTDTTNSDIGIGGSPMKAGPFPNFNANFDFASFSVTSVTDTTPPDITLNVFAATSETNPVNLNVGDTYTEPGANCTDPVSPANPGADNLGAATVGGDTVNTSSAGTYVVTYDCADSSGNNAVQATRTVNVTAAGTPVITIVGNNPFTHEAVIDNPYTDPGATCNDPEDGAIAPLDGSFTAPQDFKTTSNNVNENVPGAYQVVYDCTDSAGNSAPTATRTVNVVDTTSPVITLTPGCVGGITIEAGDPDPTPVATASDEVDGDLTGSINATGSVNTTPNFITGQLSQAFPLNWTVQDSSLNQGNASCNVVVGRPAPVVTLLGSATVNLNVGESFTDPGATCQDFKDGDLGAATPDTVVDTSVEGSQPITYSCTDSDTNVGTAVRNVTVGGNVFVNSNFSMINPAGKTIGGTNDVTSTWDGTLNTPTDLANGTTTVNMTLESARPEPFFGSTWVAHDVRVFGPGTYQFETCDTPGSTIGSVPCFPPNILTMTVGPDQVGAHMLFDWGIADPTTACGKNSCNIDVAIVWNRNQTFPPEFLYQGAAGLAPDPATAWNLGVVDTVDDSNSTPGIRMVDGPFAGFEANFNLATSVSNVEQPTVQASIPSPGGISSAGCVMGPTAGDLPLRKHGEWILIAGLMAWWGRVIRRRSRS